MTMENMENIDAMENNDTEEKEFVFEVTKVEWERIFLSIDIKTDYEGKVKFRLESIGKGIKDAFPVKYEEHENGIYHFTWNIAAMKVRQFLDNGRWRIVAATKEGDFVCHEIGRAHV